MNETAIIIPVFNLSWMTINLLESIKETSSMSHNIIVIDNGSSNEEYKAVNEWLDNSGLPFTHIRSIKPLGFVKAVNLGIDEVLLNNTYKYFFVMNNDTMLTSQWDIRMMDSLKLSNINNVGLVGPMSSPPDWSQIEQGKRFIENKEKYSTIKDNLERYALALRDNLDGMVVFKDFVPFFCTGFNVSMIRQIGKLDEDYNMGLFDDNDFCYRAINAGWKIVLRKDCYVHHLHNSTFKEAYGMDQYFKWLSENKRIFIKKHGFDPWPDMPDIAENPNTYTQNNQKNG